MGQESASELFWGGGVVDGDCDGGGGGVGSGGGVGRDGVGVEGGELGGEGGWGWDGGGESGVCYGVVAQGMFPRFVGKRKRGGGWMMF